MFTAFKREILPYSTNNSTIITVWPLIYEMRATAMSLYQVPQKTIKIHLCDWLVA